MYRKSSPSNSRGSFFATIFLLLTCSVFSFAQLPGQWTSTTLATTNKVRTFLVNGTTVLAGTSSTGVWSSADNGTTWTQINTGLTFLDVKALAGSGSTLYAGTNGGGIFRSIDNGTTWTTLNTGLTNPVINAFAISGTDVFAATNGNGVLKLTGTTWAPVNTGISTSARVYSLFANGSDLWAGGELIINNTHHIFRSSDKGATWVATGGTDTSKAASPSEFVYSFAVNGTTLLAATFDGVYRSTNNGTNWTLLDGIPIRAANILSVSAANAFYVSGSAQDGSSYGVSVSTDNGNTWRASSYGLPGAIPLTVNGTNLFAGSSLGGVSISPVQPPANASTSAADYRVANSHAPESIATIFGTSLATSTVSAPSIPLPTTLNGTTVKVLDSLGVERSAPLFFVSAGQINYQVPAGTAVGWAYITTKNTAGVSSYATTNIVSGAFSLFTSNSTGTGVPAAYIQRVKANGSQQIEIVGQFNSAINNWVTTPIDLGPETDQVYLILFGTGIRGWNGATASVVAYFGTDATSYVPSLPLYAGAQPNFVGVDQVNVLLPRSLAGRGEINAYLTANGGPTSNIVKINLR